MTYVIDTASESSGLWRADGTELRYCRATNRPGRLEGRSLDGYAEALGGCGGIYVTSSVLNVFRSAPDWDEIVPMIIAEVVNSPMTIKRCDKPWEEPRYEHILKPDAIIGPIQPSDPCENVSCPDMCIGVDKYDQVCQAGICVRGTLIETNSVHCGYVTPSPDPEDPDPAPKPSDPTVIYIAAGGALIIAYYILSR